MVWCYNFELKWLNIKTLTLFADCCQEIKVTLTDDVLEKQSKYQGSYKIESYLLNGRKHWTSLDGIRALWYNNEHNVWAFGLSSNLGSNVVSILSVHDPGCPIQNGMRYKYNNRSSWLLAPKKSVSLTCSWISCLYMSTLFHRILFMVPHL